MACDGERKKYEAEKTERLKNWQPPSDESVSFMKSILDQLQIGPLRPRMSEEALETRMRMPHPLATINTDNDGDMELAKQVFGAEALRRLAGETDGDPQTFHEQFLKNAEDFRVEQGKLDGTP